VVYLFLVLGVFVVHIFRNKMRLLKGDGGRYSSENEGDDHYYRVLAEISNNSVDSDYHIMAENTLRNFAKDADVGVQVKDGHSYNHGFGVTFDGEYISKEKDIKVLSGLRISRGYELGVRSSYRTSDVFIKAIGDGVISDVSIGAYGGKLICNICKDDMFGSNGCYHWPGRTYELIDSKDNVSRVVCTATYDGGSLREVSLVDKGACPGAEILARLDHHVRGGHISGSDLSYVKGMYGILDNNFTSVGDPGVNSSGVVDEKSTDVVDTKGKKDVSGGKLMSDDVVRVSELQADNDRLRDELKVMREEVEKRDRRISELYHAESELKGEKDRLRIDILSQWKLNRGVEFTGDDLKRYEDRLDQMDIWNLKEEKVLVFQIAELKKGRTVDDSVDPVDSGSDDGGSGSEKNSKTVVDPKRDVADSDDHGEEEDRSAPLPPTSRGDEWGKGVFPRY